MKALKVLIKPFGALQRSAKIKIYVNFLSSSGIGKGTGTVKMYTRPLLDISMTTC